MPKYSKASRDRLNTCHKYLIDLFNKVILTFDCSILEGQRGAIKQNEYYGAGKSKLSWPLSKHNKVPSLAIDAAPYPIDWKDINRFYYFGGYVKGMAADMGIPIRWGGDWDDDTQVMDQRFKDLAHFELPAMDWNTGRRQDE